MSERRRSERRVMSVPARIQPAGGGAPMVCAVTDISDSGAQLRVAVADVPKRFTLLLSNDGRIKRHCKVVRQRGIEIGVEFL